MKKYLILVIISLLVLTKELNAQVHKKRNAFVSTNSGVYIPSRSDLIANISVFNKIFKFVNI